METLDLVKTDEEAVKEWVQRCVENNTDGDLIHFGNYWTDSAVWLPPKSPALIGKGNILNFIEPFFDEFKVDQEIKIEEVEIVGDIAVVRLTGTERFSHKKENGEHPTEITSKEIIILHRQTSGDWLGTHAIWNVN